MIVKKGDGMIPLGAAQYAVKFFPKSLGLIEDIPVSTLGW